jgi:hypothetical protein
MSAQRVFISHSHEDRDTAVLVESVLKQHQAETFLDQDRIEVGEVLPARLENGIRWCNKFLLLWSAGAARSAWVEREWNIAYDLRKMIIPYRLDTYPFPDALQDRVFVDINDKTRAHGGLLTAVFGRDFEPADPTTLFPGKWQLLPATGGLAETTTDVELRPNGQVLGTVHIGSGGLFGHLLGSAGMGHFLNLEAPVRGKWTYEEVTEILTIDVTSEFMGQTNHQVVQIRTTGKERRQLQGRDLMGNIWGVRRLS